MTTPHALLANIRSLRVRDVVRDHRREADIYMVELGDIASGGRRCWTHAEWNALLARLELFPGTVGEFMEVGDLV